MNTNVTLLSLTQKTATVPTKQGLYNDGDDIYTEMMCIKEGADRIFINCNDMKVFHEIFKNLHLNTIADVTVNIKDFTDKIKTLQYKKWWQFWK